MKTKWYVVFGVCAATALLVGLSWAFLPSKELPNRDMVLPVVPPTDKAISAAPVIPAAGPSNKMPAPEPVFVLPSDAVAIDDFAFISKSEVYFKSLTSTQPLPVPGSRADSFERVSDFMTYSVGSVVSDCGAAPQYAYYRDAKQVYFYHYWRTPVFRSSHIDILIGLPTEKFELISPTQVKVGNDLFVISYTKATTTCRLKISGKSLNS